MMMVMVSVATTRSEKKFGSGYLDEIKSDYNMFG